MLGEQNRARLQLMRWWAHHDVSARKVLHDQVEVHIVLCQLSMSTVHGKAPKMGPALLLLELDCACEASPGEADHLERVVQLDDELVLHLCQYIALSLHVGNLLNAMLRISPPLHASKV